MKRAEIAYIADIRPKRMDLLKERGQLPFAHRVGGGYTLREAFQLKAMLTLMDGAGGGLGPDDARRLVVNAGGYAVERYGSSLADLIVSPGCWLGGVEFTGENRAGVDERWLGWYAGPLDELEDWMADQVQRGAEGLRVPRAVRVLGLVNATAEAAEVLSRATELGIADG